MNKILFFAHLKDAAGKEEMTLQASGKKIGDLKNELMETYDLPNLDTCMVAVNEEFANDDDTIQEGDIIAFIPPVSGG